MSHAQRREQEREALAVQSLFIEEESQIGQNHSSMLRAMCIGNEFERVLVAGEGLLVVFFIVIDQAKIVQQDTLEVYIALPLVEGESTLKVRSCLLILALDAENLALVRQGGCLARLIAYLALNAQRPLKTGVALLVLAHTPVERTDVAGNQRLIALPQRSLRGQQAGIEFYQCAPRAPAHHALVQPLLEEDVARLLRTHGEAEVPYDEDQRLDIVQALALRTRNIMLPCDALVIGNELQVAGGQRYLSRLRAAGHGAGRSRYTQRGQTLRQAMLVAFKIVLCNILAQQRMQHVGGLTVRTPRNLDQQQLLQYIQFVLNSYIGLIGRLCARASNGSNHALERDRRAEEAQSAHQQVLDRVEIVVDAGDQM